MIFGRGKDDIYFNGRVEGFSRQYKATCQNERHPLDDCYLKVHAEDDDCHKYGDVDPCIMSRLDEQPDASPRVHKTFCPRYNRELFSFAYPQWFFHDT